jgi:membrane-bound lytic murein transglycosylase A
MYRFLTIALMGILTACGQPSDKTQLTPVAFGDLPGWQYDHQGEAFTVFANSCKVNLSRPAAFTSKMEGDVGNPGAWQRVCMQAAPYARDMYADPLMVTDMPVAPTLDDDQARSFFETNFTPYRVNTQREPFAQFTGYYLPLLQGSLMPDATYRVPVYGLPSGYVKGMALPERADIVRGALKGRAPVLLYVDDPVMLFFVHIQGSGKVQLRDGSIVTIQYAGANGQSYVAIGKPMKDAGYLQEVSLQTIRDWLYANPVRADAVMNLNPSYVFFSLKTDEPTAKGALGLSLTPLRSIAIDDDRSTYGVPIYLATTHPNYYTQTDEPLNRLMVSQDTGGALHGPHRADIFFGIGPEAEWAAGHQNTRGDAYWLLPN